MIYASRKVMKKVKTDKSKLWDTHNWHEKKKNHDKKWRVKSETKCNYDNNSKL